MDWSLIGWGVAVVLLALWLKEMVARNKDLTDVQHNFAVTARNIIEANQDKEHHRVKPLLVQHKKFIRRVLKWED